MAIKKRDTLVYGEGGRLMFSFIKKYILLIKKVRGVCVCVCEGEVNT